MPSILQVTKSHQKLIVVDQYVSVPRPQECFGDLVAKIDFYKPKV